MENEPLPPYSSPRNRTPALFPLPENDVAISLPLPLTPSEFKDRLIFGPSPSSSPSPIESSPLLDALTSSHENITTLQDPLLPQQNQLNPAASTCSTDPNFTREKTHLHRCKTAPAIAVPNDVIHPSIPKPQFGSQTVVRQAFVLLLLYLSLGVVIYWFNRPNFVGHETHPVVDALYFCIVTMCTIGYGDIIPNSVATKLFSILFVLVGFGFIDILLSGMVSYVLDLQKNYLLRTVQHEGGKKDSARSYVVDVKKGRMKVGLALGVVVLCIGIGVGVMHFVESLGKSEFVVYKLKVMGKVPEKDIMQICETFDRLDVGNCGKITLADLVESHH